MFPLWDDIPSQRVPFVNYSIIAACIIAFVIQIQAPEGPEQFVRKYGMIPIRVTHPNETRIILETRSDRGRVKREVVDLRSPVSPYLTLLTCMFLHGGLMHIVGNLWFLYIFGDNVEDRFGHLGYALMYLICGISAGLMHIAVEENSVIPTIGASGAIAGVMGAYLFLYPHARVMTIVPLGIFSQLIPIPAAIFLIIWFAFQILSGIQPNPNGAGVAWWAHVGGFLAGLGMTAGLLNVGDLHPPAAPRPQRYF